MKEVNYREDDWYEAKSALAPFASANWVGGLFNNLEKVSKNMEEAEEDIQELDSDRAISFQHTNYRGKYSAIEDDLMVLYKFSCHAREKVENLIDQPFYEKLDAFVDGMQDLSISTYSTTNRIGAKSKQTYMSSYDNQPQVIESVKDNATIEDLLNGDNFYANQMQLQYRDWKRANPEQDVSEKDFQMGMLHSRAFEYKSIKDEQQEKEFWVNIVATVVIIGVSIFCPPAGMALAVGYASLEAGSAISGKDWVSGRELSTEERVLRGGLSLLDIVPGVKAFSTGAKAASTGSKLIRVGDNVLAGSKNAAKLAKGTIDNGIQAGKQAMDLRLANAQKAAREAGGAVQKKLTKDLNDIGAMAKTAHNKFKESFTLPPREQLAFAGGGNIPEQNAAGAAAAAAKKKLQEIMQKMDNLNVKGGGKAGIIEGASEAIDDIPTAFKQTEFVSTYEARIGQTPALGNKKVQFVGVRGESLSTLKPPPDAKLESILKNAGVDGVYYKNGVPDFSPFSKAEIEMDYMLGGKGAMGSKARDLNFQQANSYLANQLNDSPELAKAFGMESGNIKPRDIEKYRVQNNLTWHELNDGKTIQLVPSEINSTFGHLGGVGEINAGAFVK